VLSRITAFARRLREGSPPLLLPRPPSPLFKVVWSIIVVLRGVTWTEWRMYCLDLALRVVLSSPVLDGRAHLRAVQSDGGESVVGIEVRMEPEV
jgi:hypothetical protein